MKNESELRHVLSRTKPFDLKYSVFVKPDQESYQEAVRAALLEANYAMLAYILPDVAERSSVFEEAVVAMCQTDKWLGTHHPYGPETRVECYELTQPLKETLLQADSFRTFRGPKHPEDLSLWTADGQWLLGMISHEHWLLLNSKAVDMTGLTSIIDDDPPVHPTVDDIPKHNTSWPLFWDGSEAITIEELLERSGDAEGGS